MLLYTNISFLYTQSTYLWLNNKNIYCTICHRSIREFGDYKVLERPDLWTLPAPQHSSGSSRLCFLNDVKWLLSKPVAETAGQRNHVTCSSVNGGAEIQAPTGHAFSNWKQSLYFFAELRAQPLCNHGFGSVHSILWTWSHFQDKSQTSQASGLLFKV